MDAQAILGAELAQFLGQLFIQDRGRNHQLADVAPPRMAQGLEKILAIAVVADRDFQLHTGNGEGGHAHGPLEFQQLGGQRQTAVGNLPAAPVDHRRIRALPEVFVRRPRGKRGFKRKRKPTGQFGIALKNGPEFQGPGQGAVHQFRGGFKEQAQFCLSQGGRSACGKPRGHAPQVVTLSLLHLCDRTARITTHDGEVVAQRGVTVFLFQAEFDQPDQFRALDRLGRIRWQNFRKNFLQLIPQIHGADVMVSGGVRSAPVQRRDSSPGCIRPCSTQAGDPLVQWSLKQFVI